MRIRIAYQRPPWWLVIAAGWAASLEAIVIDRIPNISPLVPPLLASLTFCLSLVYYLWRFRRGSYLEVSRAGIRRAEPAHFVGSSWRVRYDQLVSVDLSVSGRVRLRVRYPLALVKNFPPEKHQYVVTEWLADPQSFETALRLYAPSLTKISWVSPSLEEVEAYVFEPGAGILRRATAFVLDAAFAILLTMTTSMVLLVGGVVRGDWVWLGSPAIWFLYTWAANALGQSEGKRITRLRVEALSGEPPGLWRGLRRTIAHAAIGLTLGIGYLWILTNREARGLHDLVAGTRVVRGVRRPAVPALATPPAYHTTNPGGS